MSKMSNLYLEQSEIAQNYIADYANGHYTTIEAAKKAFIQDPHFVNFVGAESVFDDEAAAASEIGII